MRNRSDVRESSNSIARRMRPERRLTRVISLTSGKGGVGKTTSTVNLAIALSRLGNKVLILDADFSLANVNVLLGMKPLHTLQHVFEQNLPVKQIVMDGPENVSVIPAGSGVDWLATLDTAFRQRLVHEVEEVASQYDYLLVDTAAGIGPEVQYFNGAAAEMVVVVNEEPTSLTDAYALIKLVHQQYGQKNISILLNGVSSEQAAKRTFVRLADALEQFLHIQVSYAGFIPFDKAVNEAICQQKALVELYPGAPAARGYSSFARQIDACFYQPRPHGGVQFFFEQLLEVGGYGT